MLIGYQYVKVQMNVSSTKYAKWSRLNSLRVLALGWHAAPDGVDPDGEADGGGPGDGVNSDRKGSLRRRNRRGRSNRANPKVAVGDITGLPLKVSH